MHGGNCASGCHQLGQEVNVQWVILKIRKIEPSVHFMPCVWCLGLFKFFLYWPIQLVASIIYVLRVKLPTRLPWHLNFVSTMTEASDASCVNLTRKDPF
jgi:hypothetical protein